MAANYKKKTAPKKPYYEEISERLIKQIKEGTAPWMKPWTPGQRRRPYNPTTGNNYKGGNALWLAMQSRSDPRWMTYKQALDNKAQVKKGSKATSIQYWKFQEEKQKRENGKPVFTPGGEKVMQVIKLEKPRVFAASVFNAEQIEGLPPLETAPLDKVWQEDQRAETILKNSGVPIKNDQDDRAFYSPAADEIHTPDKDLFESKATYYAVAFHELAHSTGHHSRLDRDLGHPFGSEGYAKEELRAEIGSMWVGEELQLDMNQQQHASYVESWVKVLRDDPTEILRAAKDAEKINDLVLSYEVEQKVENTEAVNAVVLKVAEKFSKTLPVNQQQNFIQKVEQKLKTETIQPTIKIKEKAQEREPEEEEL